MEIVKRYTTSGIGWYFGEPIKHFDNVGIQISILHSYNLVIFEYYGKKHRLKLQKGRYGLHFRFGNTTYYLKGDVKE
jgi:hypothetical protein